MAWTLRDFKDVRTQVNPPTTGLVAGQTLWHVPEATGAGTIQVWNGTAWENYAPSVEALDEEFFDAFQASMRASQLDLETHLSGAPATHITSGQFPIARLASGTPDGTKFIRDDGALAVPTGSTNVDDVKNYGAVGRGPSVFVNTTSGTNTVLAKSVSGLSAGRWVEIRGAASYNESLLARIRSISSLTITLEDASAANLNAGATIKNAALTQVAVGSITSGTNSLVLDSSGAASTFSNGQWIAINGALGGQTLVARIRTKASNTLTLEDAAGANLNATTTVTNALVDHDDTSAIQAALDARRSPYLSAADGGYRITNTLYFRSGTHLSGLGFASRLVKASPRDSFRALDTLESTDGVRDVVLSGIEVNGDWSLKTPLEWAASTSKSLGDEVKPVGTTTANQAGRWIVRAVAAGTTGTVEPNWASILPGATITDGGVTWLKLRPASEEYCMLVNVNNSDTATNQRMKVVDATIRNWPGIGLRFNGGTDVAVSRVILDSVIRGGIVCSRSGGKVIISGCTVMDCGDDGIAINTAANSDASNPSVRYERFTVTGCLVRHRSDAEFGAGIKLLGARFGTVTGCEFINSKNAGVVLADQAGYSCENVTIVGNGVIASQLDGMDISGAALIGIQIEDNNVHFPTRHGIYVSSSTATDDLQIVGNRIRNAGSSTQATARSIKIDNGTLTNVMVNDNQVRNSAERGISITATVGTLSVAGNEVYNSGVETSGSTNIFIDSTNRFNVSSNIASDDRATKRTNFGIRLNTSCANGLAAANFSLDADTTTGAGGGVSISGSATNVTASANKT